MSPTTRRPSGEEGAVAIIVAVTLSVLLLFAAFAIDLGAMRADRSLNQSVADMATAAAAKEYQTEEAGSAREACLQARAYAEANLGVSFTAVNAGCDEFPGPAEVCQPGDVRRAIYEVVGDPDNPYTLVIVNPVSIDDDLMAGESFGTDIDGTDCDRIGVWVGRTRDFLFAGAGGSDWTSGRTSMGSVGRAQLGGDGEFASMIVLERNGCQALSNAGGANIRVFNLVLNEGTPDEEVHEGSITVDTRPAGCSGNQKVIQARTATGALVEATGKIVAHALRSADPDNTWTYPPAAVPDNLRGGPQAPFDPIPGPRITRAPVDDLVNCHPGGYPSGHTWSPDRFGQDIGACEEGRGPYIADLKAAVGGVTTAAAATADPAWAVYPDAIAGQECDDGGVITPSDVGSDRLFVDCLETGNPAFDPDGLELVDFTHISFRETVRIDGDDDLEIRHEGDDGTVLYLPSGGIDHRNGNLRLRNVFGYIDAPNGSEALEVTGNADEFAWEAPLNEDDCATPGGAPNAACFAPLALWSNGQGQNAVQSTSAGGGVIGTVFTPNAPFRVRGTSGLGEDDCSDTVTWDDLIVASQAGLLNFESAQFFAARVNTAGGGMVRLCPSPETAVEVPLSGSGLIR